MSKPVVILILGTLLFWGVPSFAVDSEPVMKTKMCNTAETNCTEVKAASTAPVAADKAAVVVQSPNGNHATAALQTTLNSSINSVIGTKPAGTAATNSQLSGCVYNSAGVTLTNAQQAACQFTVDGRLKTDGAITSTVGSYIDKGSFVYGTDKFNPTGGIFQDTAPTLTSGTVGVSRMTQYRALHVNLRDSLGDEFATIDNPLIIAPATSTGRFNQGDVTLAATALAKVNRTVYTEQTANAQRSIVSASANDIAAGTGARTVRIDYCTVAGVCGLSETVTLNGVTPVNTAATDICYIERIFVTTVGSTGSNVGIISLKAATAGGGVTIGTINATDNRTFWGHHYVDSGKTMNITGISVSHNGTTVGSGGVFILRSIPLNVANQVEQQISDFVRLYGQSSTFSRNYASPIPVIGPARVTLFVTPETGSSTVYRGAMDYFEQ